MRKEEISNQTKRKMAESLKKFMAKKPFDKITVRDILEDCDISRQTFYYHFEDMYDLLTWLFETELISLLQESENVLTWDEGILLVLRYVEQNRAVCLCAYHSIGRDELHRMFHEQTAAMVDRFVENVRQDYPKATDEDTAVITDFISLALVSILVEWMKTPKGRTPEEVIREIDLVYHGTVQNALARSGQPGF